MWWLLVIQCVTALTKWDKTEAYQVFGFSSDLSTLLVTGGSLGALSINQALIAALQELLPEMQIVHLTGEHIPGINLKMWLDLYPLNCDHATRLIPICMKKWVQLLPSLIWSFPGPGHLPSGSIPHFGIPAILVPYPHAWRYQKVNADYLGKPGSCDHN